MLPRPNHQGYLAGYDACSGSVRAEQSFERQTTSSSAAKWADAGAQLSAPCHTRPHAAQGHCMAIQRQSVMGAAAPMQPKDADHANAI